LSQAHQLREDSASVEVFLTPESNDRLANLCGQFDENLRQIEQRLQVQIHNRGNRFRVIATPEAAQAAVTVLKSLYGAAAHEPISAERVHLQLQEAALFDPAVTEADEVTDQTVHVRRGAVQARGNHQIE